MKTPSFDILERQLMRHPRCGTRLRLKKLTRDEKGLSPLGKDWWLICDKCEVATVAPASMNDFLEEYNRVSAHSGSKRPRSRR